MIIRKNIDEKDWQLFISEHLHGNIFQTWEMHEVYKQSKNTSPVFLAVFDSKDALVGTMLSVIQKEHSGVLGHFSARAIIWGGPLIKDNDPVVLDYILKEYNKIIKKKPSIHNLEIYGTGKSIKIFL